MEWFRFYHEALDDPKVQRLAPPLFKHWVNLLCLASRQADRGTLPAVEDIAFALRIKPSEAAKIIRDLRAAGLIDPLFSGPDDEIASKSRRYQPHNWPQRQPTSDDVAARVKSHRANKHAQNRQEMAQTLQSGALPVTLHETPHIQPCNVIDKSREEQIQSRAEQTVADAPDDVDWDAVGHATQRDKSPRIKPVPKPTHAEATITAYAPVVAAYPARRDVLPDYEGGLAAFAAVPATEWPRVLAGVQTYAAHEDTRKENGRYVMDIARFISERHWTRYQPKPAPDPTAPPPRAAWLIESDARRAAKAARLAAAAAGKELSA